MHISFLTIFSSIFRIEKIYYFETISISPLRRNDTTTIEVVATWNYFEFEIYLKNDKYPNGVVIAADTIINPKTCIYTYNNEYTRGNNEIYFKYRWRPGTTARTSGSYAFNVGSHSNYNFDDETVRTSTQTIGVFHKDMSFETVNLTYTFEGFQDYYAPDYYQRIDLCDFHIYIDEKYHPFMHAVPSLVIANVDGVFDDIEGSDDLVLFPLELIETENGFSFTLTSTFYVDPFTLLMSSYPKQGYVQTQNIFLPVNKMREQSEFESYFSISKFGIDNDYIIHHFTLCAQSNIMGDCTNSQYCVIRENK